MLQNDIFFLSEEKELCPGAAEWHYLTMRQQTGCKRAELIRLRCQRNVPAVKSAQRRFKQAEAHSST